MSEAKVTGEDLKDIGGADREDEAKDVRGQEPVRQPTQQEKGVHMWTHMPFRALVHIHCVKGKRKNDPHNSVRESEEQDIPMLLWDCTEQRWLDRKAMGEGDGRQRLIIAIDRENEWTSEIDPYAVEAA